MLYLKGGRSADEVATRVDDVIETVDEIEQRGATLREEGSHVSIPPALAVIGPGQKIVPKGEPFDLVYEIENLGVNEVSDLSRQSRGFISADHDGETWMTTDGSAEGADRVGGFVETYTGSRFFPFDPRPSEIRLVDVAAGLAHTCRFGGHCRQFYSVAHHSLHVSDELAAEGHGPRVQLYGLLHDAAEAYLGDLPRPVKTELDRFVTVEDEILDAVWAAFELPAPSDEEWAAVMAADDRLLAYEANELLVDASWVNREPELGYDLWADSIEAVRGRFLDRAETLLER